MSVKYLLDENIDPVYSVELLRHEPQLIVWMVGDPGAPKKGALDPEILSWCESHNFALVTKNRKSMRGHLTDHLAKGHHVPGIFILNRGMSFGDTIDQLILLALASLEDEFRDQIINLPYQG